MRNFLFAAIAALTLGVGSASAYAAQVDWLQNLQDHSRAAYQDDSAA